MDPEERAAICRAAWEDGLRGADLDALLLAIREPKDLASIDLLALDAPRRLVVYALGVLLARARGPLSDERVRALGALGDALGLCGAERRYAATTAWDGAPGDFAAFAAVLAREVEEAQKPVPESVTPSPRAHRPSGWRSLGRVARSRPREIA